MPWTNVMSNGQYGLVLSQNGGGFSWGDNSQVSRITRWNQDLVEDRQGRFVFLQDLGEPEALWATTRQPVETLADYESVTHGLGYTVFSRTFSGIETNQAVFVPEDDACEVWILKIKNKSGRERSLRLASYLEWELGAANDWHREFHRLFYASGHERDFTYARKLPGLIHESREPEPKQPLGFHGVNGLVVRHWIADKSSFLGNPANLGKPGFLFGHIPELENPRWNDPVACAVGDVTLKADEEKTIVFVIGTTPDVEVARELVAKYTPSRAKSELDRTKQKWVDFCSRSTVKTGNDAFDLMNGYWLKYQTLAARIVARCAYYQQGGAYGFRDQLQDSLAMLTLDPAVTRKQLLIHCEATYEDGAVRHWWHPHTQIFAESHHSDTCLWVPYAVLAYLDETNDLGFLSTVCSYLNRETQMPGESATVLEHCLLGIRRTLGLRSERGIPLIFSGDWNDGLSHAGIEGKGESCWLGMFLFDILRRWIPVLKDMGREAEAQEFEAAAGELQSAINTHGWDGNWYLQGTRDDRLPLGGASCTEGRIFLNPQTWSVISGIAPEDRASTAIDSAKKHLLKHYGALLLTPAFSELDPYVGYITRYAPGLRENGGVYSHASTWMIQALSMAGHQDEARKLYEDMLPCNGRDAEQYVAEPYVMPGNVDGPDSPFEGRAGWTWYTGSSGWMYRMALEWICGVRATRSGLLIAPKSGSKPLSFELRRAFREDVFHIKVEGQGSRVEIQSETAEILDGNLLQSTGTGAEHIVNVRLF
jgi:cellobiose phosphorylase